jgi:hypothetical protein
MNDARDSLFWVALLLLWPWAVLVLGIAWVATLCLVLDWGFHRYEYRFWSVFPAEGDFGFLLSSNATVVGILAAIGWFRER